FRTASRANSFESGSHSTGWTSARSTPASSMAVIACSAENGSCRCCGDGVPFSQRCIWPSTISIWRILSIRSYLRPLQPDILERRRPRKRVDLHQRGLLDARPDPARPEEVVDRRKPGPLVQHFLDLVQHCFALRMVRFRELLLIELIDIGPAAIGVGTAA